MLGPNFRCDLIHNNHCLRIWSQFVMLLKYNLDVQQTSFRGRFVKQKLMLSTNLRCDLIHNNDCYTYGRIFCSTNQPQPSNGLIYKSDKHTTSRYNTQCKGIISDIQHNDTLALCWMSLCWVLRFIYCYAEIHYAKCDYAKCHYAECRGAQYNPTFI